jgi:hypothetical protein
MASRNVWILASSVHVRRDFFPACSRVFVFADKVISDFYSTPPLGHIFISLSQQNYCCNCASIILKGYATHRILRLLLCKFSVMQGKQTEFSLEQTIITAVASVLATQKYCQIRHRSNLNT